MSYKTVHAQSIQDPNVFWGEEAKHIHWEKPFDAVLDYSKPPFAHWFKGGLTNLCYNAVDRHLADRGDQIALVAVSTETDIEKTYTFKELHAEVNRMAAILKANGVGKGDRVLIYMPMIAEASFAMLACARIGAIHSVVFGGFASRAGIAVLNLDNPGTASLAATMIRQNEEAGTDYGVVTFSVEGGEADFRAETLQPLPAGMSFSVSEHGKPGLEVVLNVPGAHNVANALAALAAVRAVGVTLPDAIAALQTFTGIRRRLEVVGTRSGITVIDDFAHNPDKIAATLRTLHAFEGRLLILFQPHGFGPLRLMKSEFIEGFASLMNDEDILLLPEPVYYGGTTDRSVGSLDIAQGIRSRGRKAEALPTRTACGERLVELARPGDRILIMGARDDTLSEFAQALLDQMEH